MCEWFCWRGLLLCARCERHASLLGVFVSWLVCSAFVFLAQQLCPAVVGYVMGGFRFFRLFHLSNHVGGVFFLSFLRASCSAELMSALRLCLCVALCTPPLELFHVSRWFFICLSRVAECWFRHLHMRPVSRVMALVVFVAASLF